MRACPRGRPLGFGPGHEPRPRAIIDGLSRVRVCSCACVRVAGTGEKEFASQLLAPLQLKLAERR